MTLITFKTSGGEEGRCDAKCYNAKNAVCDCVCGGRNRSAGEKQALENTKDMFHEMAEDWNQKHPDHKVVIPDDIRQDELFNV